MAENTAVYEGMFILDANRMARDRESLPSELASMIEEAAGSVLVSRMWEERRLAYPIKGQRKGVYWITYFRFPTTSLADLTRQLELKDGVLRHLFIRLPESLVEPILEHAKGQPAQENPPAKETDESANGAAAVSDAVETAAS